MRYRWVVLLVLICTFRSASQINPVVTDTLPWPKFQIAYGDTIYSKENPATLAALVRFIQLHSTFRSEVKDSTKTLDDFVSWLGLYLQGYSKTTRLAELQKHSRR